MLLTGIDRTAARTPRPTVCARLSTALETIRRKDAAMLMQPGPHHRAGLKRCHNRLLAGDQPLTAIDAMLSALAAGQRRSGQPRFPGRPAANFAAPVATSPHPQEL